MKPRLSLLILAATFIFLAVPQSSEANWWKSKKKEETKECSK